MLLRSFTSDLTDNTVRTLPGHFDVPNEDANAIERTALDSIEGHYEGNADGWVPEQLDKPEEA
jgi:hypothetical protein